MGSIDQLGDDVDEENDEKHSRMLQSITGMPSEAFERIASSAPYLLGYMKHF